MTNKFFPTIQAPHLYINGSRMMTHVAFWVGYYIAFSLIWATPHGGYYASFYLEFVLLPTRIAAVYVMLYYLIPEHLVKLKIKSFIIQYLLLLCVVAFLHRTIDFYFYDRLIMQSDAAFWQFSQFFRAGTLINTTVVLVASVKIFQMYLMERSKNETGGAAAPITIKSEGRNHVVNPSDILYVESMGNYATYYMADGNKLVCHTSLKKAEATLPDTFTRVSRGYVVNRDKVTSFTADQLFIGDKQINITSNIDLFQ